MSDDQEWRELRKLILFRLDQLDAHVVRVDSKIDTLAAEQAKHGGALENLKGRSGAWGAMAGAIGGGAVALAVALILRAMGG